MLPSPQTGTTRSSVSFNNRLRYLESSVMSDTQLQQVPVDGRSEPKEAVPAPGPNDDHTARKSNSHKKGKGKEGGGKKDEFQKSSQGGSKLRGSPRESEETRMSKTLTWVLRHGSQSEKLSMRPDGYVRVTDIVSLGRLSRASNNANAY